MGTSRISGAAQFLTYMLNDEIFALNITRVREVLDFTTVTRVPRTPDFMRGVINLRGSVVPVIDLRLTFGLPQTEKTLSTCVIITEVDVDGDAVVLGVLADSVQEVLELGPDSIEPPPRIGDRLRTAFLEGMGKNGDRFIMIMNIDKVFSAGELSSAMQLAGGNIDRVASAA